PSPGLEQALRKLVASIDPQLAIAAVAPMESIRHDALNRPRFGAETVGLFCAFGLLLAALGTFGVISFTIAQRRKEMGVRMALGATAPRIAALVLRRGLTLALAGECIGALAALLLHAALQSHLTAVTGFQPLLYAVVAALL